MSTQFAAVLPFICAASEPDPNCETETQPNSPFAPYRDRTVALLRRYFRMSIEIGRLPALLGREFFRANVTTTQMHTFEDQVVFVIDIERCLDRLNRRGKKMIAVFIFQEYTFDEAVAEFRWARRTLCRALPRALDELSDMLLRHKLLEPFPHDEELLCDDRRSRGSGSSRTDNCQAKLSVVLST